MSTIEEQQARLATCKNEHAHKFLACKSTNKNRLFLNIGILSVSLIITLAIFYAAGFLTAVSSVFVCFVYVALCIFMVYLNISAEGDQVTRCNKAVLNACV